MAANEDLMFNDPDDEELVDSLIGEDDEDNNKYSDLAEEHEKLLEEDEDKAFERKFRAMAKKQEEKWESKQKSREMYAEFFSSADEFEKDFLDLLDPEENPKELKRKIDFIKKQAEKIKESLAEKQAELANQYGAPLAEGDIDKIDERVKELQERSKSGDFSAAFELFMAVPPDKV